jgi:hypothetical protein
MFLFLIQSILHVGCKEFCLFFSPSPYALNELTTEDMRNSNSNDIETKLNYASIIGVFLESKRNEPPYSITWKDRSEANTNINMLCKIEEITSIISLKFAGSKRKRI